MNVEIKNLPGDADYDDDRPGRRPRGRAPRRAGASRRRARVVVQPRDGRPGARARRARSRPAFLVMLGIDPLDALDLARRPRPRRAASRSAACSTADGAAAVVDARARARARGQRVDGQRASRRCARLADAGCRRDHHRRARRRGAGSSTGRRHDERRARPGRSAPRAARPRRGSRRRPATGTGPCSATIVSASRSARWTTASFFASRVPRDHRRPGGRRASCRPRGG